MKENDKVFKLTEENIINNWFNQIDSGFYDISFGLVKDLISDIKGDLIHSKDIISKDTLYYVDEVCSILDFDLNKTPIETIRKKIREAHIISKNIKWEED